MEASYQSWTDRLLSSQTSSLKLLTDTTTTRTNSITIGTRATKGRIASRKLLSKTRTLISTPTPILQREQIPYSQWNFGVLSTAFEFINRLPPTTHNCMTGFDTPGSQPCRKPGRGQQDTKEQTSYFRPKRHLDHRSEEVSHSETQPQLGMKESPHLSDDDSDPTYKDPFSTSVVAEQESVRCSGRSVSIRTSTAWRMGLGLRAALTPHLRFVSSNKPRMVSTTGLGSEHTPTHQQPYE